MKTFSMACPFGDWQIFQDSSLNLFPSFFFKLFNRFVVLVAKSWIDTFLAFRLHYVYYNVLLAPKRCLHNSRQENTNTIAECAHTHTHIHMHTRIWAVMHKCAEMLHSVERVRICIHTEFTWTNVDVLAFGWILDTQPTTMKRFCIGLNGNVLSSHV